VIVVGIDTCTTETSVALGTEGGTIASARLGGGTPHHELVVPTIEQLLRWSEVPLEAIGGVAVGLGPGLFTGMRVGIAIARTFAQALRAPIIGIPSLDLLAFPARYARRLVCAAIDARRGEVFYALYRPVPGGMARQTEFEVGPPARLRSELEAAGEDILLVGNGALVHRRALEAAGARVEFASATSAYPSAEALVELAVPRFLREEHDRLYEVRPIYVRKSDAEIAWDRRTRTS
jgi:tRNA threonylcarbamoyladenosine biosynthesis protein TsaB